MHAVIRTYSGAGAKKLFAELAKQKNTIEELIRQVDGFVSYTLVDTGDGGVSVTVCRDKKGTDESVRVAADWIKQNVPNTGASAPAIKEGAVVMQMK
jgi:hypothetical protein